MEKQERKFYVSTPRSQPHSLPPSAKACSEEMSKSLTVVRFEPCSGLGTQNRNCWNGRNNDTLSQLIRLFPKGWLCIPYQTTKCPLANIFPSDNGSLGTSCLYDSFVHHEPTFLTDQCTFHLDVSKHLRDLDVSKHTVCPKPSLYSICIMKN